MRHNGIVLRRGALTRGGTIRVSMQVANLEADLGPELLSRAGRNPVLVGSWCHMAHGIGWAFVSDHVIAASLTAPDRQARPAIRPMATGPWRWSWFGTSSNPAAPPRLGCTFAATRIGGPFGAARGD